MEELGGGAITYNSSLQVCANIVLRSLTQNVGPGSDVSAYFKRALDYADRYYPEGAVVRGLTKLGQGANAVRTTNLLDLGCGKFFFVCKY